MLANSLVEVEIAARLLEAGHSREAYGIAVSVLHRVGGSMHEDARRCWDRARSVALAASPRG